MFGGTFKFGPDRSLPLWRSGGTFSVGLKPIMETPAPPKMKIFISSTSGGLGAERKRVTETILKMRHEPIGMEYFSASPQPPLEECLSKVEEADLFILILGPSYGSVHSGTGLSYTENEYRHVGGPSLPLVILMAHLRLT